MDKVLVMHPADVDSIPDTSYGLMSSARVIWEYALIMADMAKTPTLTPQNYVFFFFLI